MPATKMLLVMLLLALSNHARSKTMLLMIMLLALSNLAAKDADADDDVLVMLLMVLSNLAATQYADDDDAGCNAHGFKQPCKKQKYCW